MEVVVYNRAILLFMTDEPSFRRHPPCGVRRTLLNSAWSLTRYPGEETAMLPMSFYLFLLSPFLLVPLAERLGLPSLIVPGIYLALWAAWETYLHFVRPDLWLRADLFLIVPAQIVVLVRGIRRQREETPRG